MKSQIRWGTFFKLSLVVVSSIVLTNVCTMASSDWITKNLFIQSSTFLNAKLMDNIKKNVEENNNSYLTLLRLLETDPALKNYFLAADACGTEKFIKTYDILKVYYDSVPSGTAENLVAVSNQGSAFSFTGERISVPVEAIEEMPCSAKISETGRRLQYTYQSHGITADFQDRKCVIAARRLFLPSSSESFATAYITIPEEEFYQMFSEAVPEGSRMVILSSDGQIVSGNGKDSLGREEPKLLSLVQSMRENGETYRTVNPGAGYVHGQYGGGSSPFEVLRRSQAQYPVCRFSDHRDGHCCGFPYYAPHCVASQLLYSAVGYVQKPQIRKSESCKGKFRGKADGGCL